MKLLFFKTNLFMQNDWLWVLNESGYEVTIIEYVFSDFLEDDSFAGELRKLLKDTHYDAMVSCNFFPVISDVCKECEVPYISWIYDSPIPNFYRFDTPFNRIYHFDRSEVEDYRSRGYSMICHLPLAVNTKRLDKQLGVLKDIPEYMHDISFVGNLYNNRSMEASGLTDSPYLQGLLEGYAAVQTQFFNQDILAPIFEHSSYIKVNRLNEIFPWKVLYGMIYEESTHQERNHLLNKLSDFFAVDVYTMSEMEHRNHLTIHPPVDYYSDMPDIFRHSKINLNINYRAIHSGMSARILDIMGSGGFLMTTPQPEIFDYFVEDTDFVVFRSLEELIDKCDYYLIHDDIRFQIALNGYQKIKQAHTYEKRLPFLFSSLKD